MRWTRTVFLPMGGVENPYQHQLAAHLSQEGVEVVPAVGTTLFLRKAFTEWKPDVVHLHWLHPWLATSLRARLLVNQLRVLRWTRKRIVWTVHDLASRAGRERRCGRRLARLAHAVIVHGEEARRQVIEVFGVRDESRVVVIPHGHYGDLYPDRLGKEVARAELGLPIRAFVVLYCGRIHAQKRVGDLIRAFKEWDPPDALLVIAGKQEGGEPIEGLIEGAGNILYRPGYVANDKMQVYMNAGDVVVLPYGEVLTSGSAIVAASFGKACIAPGIGAIRDALDPEGAIFYDPEIDGALVNALRAAHQRGVLLEDMGNLNRKHVAPWTWARAAKATAALYRTDAAITTAPSATPGPSASA